MAVYYLTLRRTLITSVIALMAAIMVLFTPWYPVATSQVSSSTFNVTTTNYQTVTVYTLPAPVTFPTPSLFGVNWWSSEFNLEAGSTYTLHMTQCQKCAVLVLYEANPNSAGVGVTTNLMGSGQFSFVALNTGSYMLQLGTFNYPASGTISSVTITTLEAQSGEVAETTYNTVTVSSSDSPYTILGTIPSVTILAVVAILVAFFYYRRRPEQPKTTEAKKVEPQTKKATIQKIVVVPEKVESKTKTEEKKVETVTSTYHLPPSKRLCVKCGNELAPNLKFCNKCGTEQP